MGGRGASKSANRITMVGGIGGGGGGVAPQIATNPPNVVPPAQVNAANNAVFKAVDNSPFHNLFNGRQYYLSQNIDINGQLALISYLQDRPEPGSLYSPSQNLNWNMANNLPLTAEQQFMRNALLNNMHNLGYNVNLTRYDHAGALDAIMKQNGISGSFRNMSDAQLRKMLVGTQYTENKFVSTSYNDFKNAGTSAQAFTSREIKFEYRAKAGTQAIMPGNGPGGQFGEMLLAPNQTYKVVDVKWNGNKARQKATQNYNLKQLTIVVEVG